MSILIDGQIVCNKCSSGGPEFGGNYKEIKAAIKQLKEQAMSEGWKVKGEQLCKGCRE